MTVIEEEPLDDHLSEPEILERAESRLGSRQPDVEEVSFGKQEQRIRERFKDYQTELTESIELRTEIKDIPISEKLMMMHRAEQNKKKIPEEQFQEEPSGRTYVREYFRFENSDSLTDEDRLTEIIARHSERKKSAESGEKGECGAPIISDSDSVTSNVSDDNILTIGSGSASDENIVPDEVPVINGSHEMQTEVEVRAERTQFEEIRLCAFAELLGEYNWSIPYALYKVSVDSWTVANHD